MTTTTTTNNKGKPCISALIVVGAELGILYPYTYIFFFNSSNSHAK